MEDYEKELLADFDSDEELEVETEQIEVPEKDAKKDIVPVDLDSFLKDLGNESVLSRLDVLDASKVDDINSISRVKPLIPEIKSKIELYSHTETSEYLDLLSLINDENQSDQYRFILQVNELSNYINKEISTVHSFIKIHFKPVFSELESLILNPVDYAKCVLIVKQDLKNIKDHEQDLKAVTTNEKVLVIIMSALQHTPEYLSEAQFIKVLEACHLVLELKELLDDLSKFISNKLSKFAPNVSAIVGPITTSQLLVATGSLRQLSQTPSCNIPSLGVNELATTTKVRSSNVRATGYLYHCELIRFLPPEVMKSVMRIISGKIVLAARIDLAKTSPSGQLGQKYLEDIHVKIDKLLTPPDAQSVKALPVPVEQKSKKRGGRRFRKMKERFQMSELRKAQNKMEFGKQEDYFVDSFGEEVGLGMSKSGRMIQTNSNTNAKMSKAMISRLQQDKQKTVNGQIDDFTLVNPNTKALQNSNSSATPSTASNRWFTGMKK